MWPKQSTRMGSGSPCAYCLQTFLITMGCTRRTLKMNETCWYNNRGSKMVNLSILQSSFSAGLPSPAIQTNCPAHYIQTTQHMKSTVPTPQVTQPIRSKQQPRWVQSNWSKPLAGMGFGSFCLLFADISHHPGPAQETRLQQLKPAGGMAEGSGCVPGNKSQKSGGEGQKGGHSVNSAIPIPHNEPSTLPLYWPQPVRSKPLAHQVQKTVHSAIGVPHKVLPRAVLKGGRGGKRVRNANRNER